MIWQSCCILQCDEIGWGQLPKATHSLLQLDSQGNAACLDGYNRGGVEGKRQRDIQKHKRYKKKGKGGAKQSLDVSRSNWVPYSLPPSSSFALSRRNEKSSARRKACLPSSAKVVLVSFSYSCFLLVTT